MVHLAALFLFNKAKLCTYKITENQAQEKIMVPDNLKGSKYIGNL